MKTRTLPLLFCLMLLLSCSSDSNDSNDQLEDSIPGNFLSVGESAQDLLSNENFATLKIEIVFSEGFAPDAESLPNLKSFLQARTFKQNIEILQREIPAPPGAPFTIEEITDIENKYRRLFNTENTIAVFVFFANGNSASDTDQKVILGTAFRNTSIVVYEKTILERTGNPLGPSRGAVETTTIQHEFGHLFGLVDIGSPMRENHEDPNSEGHCDTEDCLMNAKAEFAGTLMGMLGDGVPNLDQFCIQDLQANGGR